MTTTPATGRDHFADAILSALCRIEGRLDAILHQLTPPNEETTQL